MFAGCSGLREIIVAEGNTKYRSVGNCLIDAATATLMQGCASSVIPTDGSVTSIGDSAFSGHSELLSLTVPDGVVSIGHQAFAMCYGLTRITLPESVNYIGISAFFECPRLTLFCERGSYAAKYASENLIPFVGTGEVMFSDVSSSSWYYGAVSFAVNGGLFNGVSDTEFAPDRTMTRAMLVTVLWRLDGKPVPTSDAVFGDVNDGKWYTDAVSWAAACGIVNGISPDRFSPDDPITREQMAAILYRYASYKGEDVSAVGDISAFDDFDRVSGYAAVPMRWANGAGLITGIGTRLEPRDNATRAQVATILQRYCTEA